MQKLTKLLEEQIFIQVGEYTLGSGIRDGYVWLEAPNGEGTEVPTKDIEDFFSKKFNFWM